MVSHTPINFHMIAYFLKLKSKLLQLSCKSNRLRFYVRKDPAFQSDTRVHSFCKFVLPLFISSLISTPQFPLFSFSLLPKFSFPLFLF